MITTRTQPRSKRTMPSPRSPKSRVRFEQWGNAVSRLRPARRLRRRNRSCNTRAGDGGRANMNRRILATARFRGSRPSVQKSAGSGLCSAP